MCVRAWLRSHRLSVDRSVLIRLSMKSAAIYNATLQSLSHLLALKTVITARGLCVTYGCLHIRELVERAHAQYTQRMMDSVSVGVREKIKLECAKSSVVAVAFYLAAKKTKVGRWPPCSLPLLCLFGVAADWSGIH